MGIVLSLRLPPDSTAPGLARAALQQLRPAFHARLDALRLMVSELVTNCIVHVNLTPQDRIGLLVREVDGYLRVEVRDPGTAYEEALAGWSLVREVDHGNTSTGGYGLSVVETIADRSGVSWDKGTVTWFEVDLDDE
jgi:anti-sigma regulatory factor (Ser/Thr protein kinase)